MGTKERAVDSGSRLARRLVTELGREIRDARVGAGLSQLAVAEAVGISRAQVSKIERALLPRVSLLQVARLMAVLGLELSAKGYPNADPLRDAAHRALLDRLVALAGDEIVWRFEVPAFGPGDRRAWDAVGEDRGRRRGLRLRVEAETVARDCQALQRKVALKRSDDPLGGRTILLLADTRGNRAFVRAHEAALRADFQVAPRDTLDALRRGADPGGDGYILL